MLTKEWFKKKLPNEINTQEDYNKLMDCINHWPEYSESVEKLYSFMLTLKEKEKREIELKLLNLTESFLKFEIKKADFIRNVFQDNYDSLSDLTRKTILTYNKNVFDKNKAIVNVLEALTQMFHEGVQ